MSVANTGGSRCSSQNSKDNKNISLHQLLQLHQDPEQDQKVVPVTRSVGRKVTPRARRVSPQPPWPLPEPWLPPRTSLELPASLCRPALAACCAAQVSPAAVWGGRREGSTGPSRSTGLAPPALAPRGRLLCAGPCASLLLPSRPPFLLVSEAIEF